LKIIFGKTASHRRITTLSPSKKQSPHRGHRQMKPDETEVVLGRGIKSDWFGFSKS